MSFVTDVLSSDLSGSTSAAPRSPTQSPSGSATTPPSSGGCDTRCSIIVGSVVGGLSFIAVIVIVTMCICYCCCNQRENDRKRTMLRPGQEGRTGTETTTTTTTGMTTNKNSATSRAGTDRAAAPPLSPRGVVPFAVDDGTPQPESILKRSIRRASVPSSTPSSRPHQRASQILESDARNAEVGGEKAEDEDDDGTAGRLTSSSTPRKCCSVSAVEVMAETNSATLHDVESSVFDLRTTETPLVTGLAMSNVALINSVPSSNLSRNVASVRAEEGNDVCHHNPLTPPSFGR